MAPIHPSSSGEWCRNSICYARRGKWPLGVMSRIHGLLCSKNVDAVRRFHGDRYMNVEIRFSRRFHFRLLVLIFTIVLLVASIAAHASTLSTSTPSSTQITPKLANVSQQTKADSLPLSSSEVGASKGASGAQAAKTAISASKQEFQSGSGNLPDSISLWVQRMPLPILLTLLVALSTFISAAAAAGAAIWITPRTLKSIADDQAEINREAVSVAEVSANAARRSAEIAATNTANIGIHEVARLRQNWINTVRDEVSALHSDLMNWLPLANGVSPEQRSAHDLRVRATNARLAKIQLLLNPREVASRQLLEKLEQLGGGIADNRRRLWLCRWVIRWSQIVLKTEWDRVRDELQGRTPAPLKRRANRR